MTRLEIKPFYVAITLALSPTLLAADPWFHHQFGELRSYHGDWLDVCEDDGAGPCRAVQYYRPDASHTVFGESRLSVNVTNDGDYTLEIYDAYMPDYVEDIQFDFGTTVIHASNEQIRLGMDEPTEGPRFAETFFVEDQTLATELVALIRAKRWLTVRYKMDENLYGEAPFSLRGSTAALDAIDAHLAQRN